MNGPTFYEPHTRRLSGANGTVTLTPQCAVLLSRFLQDPGVCIHKERLIMALFSGAKEPQDADRRVKVNVCRLRRALRDVYAPAAITTVWGDGYVLEVGR